MRRIPHPLAKDLAWLINLLLDCHPQGLDVLLGNAPPPLPAEVHAMMNARWSHDLAAPPSGVSTTTEAERIVWDAERFESIVRAARGWAHIASVCREHRSADPALWNIVIDHTRFVAASATRLSRRTDYVCAKHGIAPNTLLRYRRIFPDQLAAAILTPPADDPDWRLQG